MSIINTLRNIYKEYKCKQLIDNNSPLKELELHSYMTTWTLRKRKDIEIGRYTYGCPSVRTGGGIAQLIIGKFCEFGPDVSIHLITDHHVDWITPYDLDVLANGRPNGYKKEDLVFKGDVVIGNDVWIGERVIILPGVKIGDGCVIGAGSVVAKDVEPYSVVVGNPCRTIRKRFNDDEIQKLLQIQWWNWTDTDIYNAIDVLQNSDVEKLSKIHCDILKRKNE